MVTGELALAAEVNANFDAIEEFLNDEVIQKDGTRAMTAALGLPASDPVSANQATRKSYVDRQGGVVQSYQRETAGTYCGSSITDAGVVLPAFTMPTLDGNLGLRVAVYCPLVEIQDTGSPDYGVGASEYWITTSANVIIQKATVQLNGVFATDKNSGFYMERIFFDNTYFAAGATVNLKVRGRLEGGGNTRMTGTDIAPIQMTATIL
jgi:hypothetical protein